MPVGNMILIVEDDAEVAATLREQLALEGFYCENAADGPSALSSLKLFVPDLILLDRVLPGMAGDDVLRKLRSDPRTRDIPVIMLTGKADEADQLVGLALGADDYILKPFSPKVLVARISTQLRRIEQQEENHSTPTARSITLDRRQAQVIVDRTTVPLTTMEYKLLAALIAARGHILGHEQLGTMLWGQSAPPANVLDGQVEGLRRKMGSAGGYIQAVPDHGYAFWEPYGRQPPA